MTSISIPAINRRVKLLLTLIGLFICLPASAITTADHSKFTELQQDFDSGPEVTKACLSCHTEAAKQIHLTKHWTWDFLNPQSKQRLGKKNIVNNFCVSPRANFGHCTACHVGYGWEDEKFDFSAEENVDCLVCHDTTGEYKKPPGLAGRPKPSTNLSHVAQNVGKTSRDSCGACHFFGGGGNGVKHGDMDNSLTAPDRELDVHMDAKGENFSCSTCHESKEHDVSGSRYTPEAASTDGIHIRRRELGEENQANCRACHDDTPHKAAQYDRLNQHARKISCQTCHIPTIARGGVATRMTWDWSTSGKLNAKGKPFKKKQDGNVVYNTKTGSFTYAENIAPEYVWFNGNVHYQLLDAKLEPDDDGVVDINTFEGSAEDGISRIWPVKVFRGVQPFDPINNTLTVIQTAGNDSSSYWKNLNWNKAIKSGMEKAHRPFSGEVDFIKTRMLWPITHMVAPAEDALGCQDCHQQNGRLQSIKGIYIPAARSSSTLDLFGWGIAALTLLGVIAHALGRILSHYRRKQT